MRVSTLFKLICFIFATSQCIDVDPDDIEIVKSHIIQTLNNSNPKAIPLFLQFSHRYAQLVDAFFDTQNNLSLHAHIQEMDENLVLLTQIIRDPQFSSVRAILINLYPHLVDLVDTVKGYLNSRNYLSLALAVRKFKFLLPDSIKKRGDISLLLSLRHRLLS